MFLGILISSAIALCIGIYTVIYVRGIYKGNVKPVLATWVLFTLGVLLSFATNFAETGGSGILANFFNLADSFAVLIILGVVLTRRDTRRSFNVFERWCIGAALIVAFLWRVSGQNVLAHLAIQAIFTVAYIPTLKHLWVSAKNTESFWMWFLNFVAEILGLIIPIQTLSFLPIVYATRALICTSMVMVCIVRVERRKANVA